MYVSVFSCVCNVWVWVFAESAQMNEKNIFWTILRLSSYIMHVYTENRAVHARVESIAEQLHMFHAHSVQFLFADRQTKTRIREKTYASHRVDNENDNDNDVDDYGEKRDTGTG